jgi:hypothetical protein
MRMTIDKLAKIMKNCFSEFETSFSALEARFEKRFLKVEKSLALKHRVGKIEKKNRHRVNKNPRLIGGLNKKYYKSRGLSDHSLIRKMGIASASEAISRLVIILRGRRPRSPDR